MRVIYIAGTSHSGSSLLGLMLNAHPEMVSAGELKDLGQQLQVRENGRFAPCACGAPSLWQCEFWSRVEEVLRQAEGRSLAELVLCKYPKPDTINAAVFRAISKAAGKQFIVDSSKRPGRLAYLMQIKGLEVYPIHLIREPKGQICSMVSKNGGLLKHIRNYVLIHEQIRRTLRSIPHSVVRYEELVLDPERTLAGVLEPLGRKFHRRQLLWAEQVQHTIAGNKLRWQPNGLVLDERWKQSLGKFQQFAIDLGTAYSRLRLAKTTRERN